MDDFFVMLNTQRGRIIPLVDDDDEVVMFATMEEAKVAGANNLIGEHFGFEVFERGLGSEG